MSNKRLRQIIRWLHIIEGSVLITFVYSSTLREVDAFVFITQFIIVPAAVISGLLLWNQGRVNKALKNFQKAEA